MRMRVREVWAAMSPQQRLVLGALLASVAMTALSLGDPKGLSRLERLRRDIGRQEEQNHKLREANASLERTARDLSQPVNPAALEKAAREQLGFVRPDDVLFKFE
jgi:cell division protein FtsB